MPNKKKLIKVIEDLIVEPPSAPGKKLKILITGPECAPYSSVGGLSSVAAYLSKALFKSGHDVRIFMPKFGSMNEEKYKTKIVIKGLKIPTDSEDNKELICNVKEAVDPKSGVRVYFLENQEYYEKRANVYGYSDDPTRWALLSRGVLEFIKTKEFVPEVIHCNDWHTSLVPNYIKTKYKDDKDIANIPTLLTIHNMKFQGMLDHRNVTELDYDDGWSEIPDFFSDRLNKINFLRRGIMFADAVNTVSRTYSKEILTPDFGEGLDRLLLEVRSKVFGIVNGLDYEEFNPATDELLEQNYDVRTLEKRIKNKTALQAEFDLPQEKNTLLLGFVGRLDGMKGVDLIVSTLKYVMRDFDVQFVQVGGGDGYFIDLLNNLKEEFPDKVGVHPYMNFTLPRMLFGGVDVILYPSRFEPCGIVQIEAMRYGAIPLVRNVGGLADTVENFDASEGKGTGFVFKDFDEFALFGQIVRAIELYKDKKKWRTLQLNAMKADFSWEYSAQEYIKLYDRAKKLSRSKHPRDTGGI